MNTFTNIENQNQAAATTDNSQTEAKKTLNHYSFSQRAIFKGFTVNDKGTYFAKISLPSGGIDNKQTYVNVSAVVANFPSIQALALAMLDVQINDGKGTSAEVTLTNMKAHHSFDNNGNIKVNEHGEPYINYTAFLNGIAFVQA